MEKKNYLIMAAVLLFISCQKKSETASVDLTAVKSEVLKTLNDIDNAMKSRDVTTFLSYMAEDGIFCGTDPEEIWNKDSYKKQIEMMVADTAMKFNMKIDKAEIIVDKSGTSANAVRQFITEWSNPISVRETIHLVKTNGKWMIDLMDFGLIPYNKDLPKITTSVTK